jgi:N-acyl-L-homoserine lactone synthetase
VTRTSLTAAAVAPDTLHGLQQAGTQLIASIAPLRIGVTEDAADLDAMFRLRGAEIAERGWASRDPGSIERDCDDDDGDAVQIAIWDAAEVVGTCRLLLPSPRRLLPLERAFGLRLEPQGGVVQWSRLVLARRCRGDPQHRLAIACFAALWRETARRGFAHCAGVVSKPMLDLYAGLGIAFEVVGPPRFVDGEQRYPAVSSASTLRTALAMMRRLA